MMIRSEQFYVTGGTIATDAACYVARAADGDLLDALRRGQYASVLATRQMGKSSLMVRTANLLRDEGVAVALLDLTEIGTQVTVEQWYHSLLSWIGDRLDLEDQLDAFWHGHASLPPLARWVGAIREVVLARPEPVVLSLDEIDSVRSLPFSTDDFFAALRACYDQRPEDAPLRRLTFCVLGAATPSDLTRDPRSAPFNISRRIELTDFTPPEAAVLGPGLDADERTAARLLDRVLFWTGGQPYLTQKLCSAVAEERGPRTPRTVDHACEQLFFQPGCRERDHNLSFVGRSLQYAPAGEPSRPEAGQSERVTPLGLYASVRAGGWVPDDATPAVESLKLSGIVEVRDWYLRPRNRIYARVFDRSWIRENTLGAERSRQLLAFRRRSLLLGALGGLVTTSLAAALYEWRQARLSEQRAGGLSAQLAMERGLSLCQRDDVNLGLLWLVRALEGAPEDEDMQRVLRMNLDAWSRELHPMKVELGQDGPVQAVALSPDGRRVVTGGVDGTAQLWEALTGRRIGPPFKQDSPVLAVALSPYGQRIATVGNDGTARIWDSEHSVIPLQRGDSVAAVAFGPSGSMVATGSLDGSTRIWDVARTAKELRLLQSGSPVAAVAFSPDGRMVVTGSLDHAAWVWDIAMGRISSQLRHEGPVNAVACSRVGRKVVTASGDHTARVWDMEKATPVGDPLRHEGPVVAATFSPDGQMVVTASDDHTARLWDVATGLPIGRPLAYEKGILVAAFGPEQNTILAGCADHTVRVWDAPSQLRGTRQQIRLRIELKTGMELDRTNNFHVLSEQELGARRDSLNGSGE